MRVFACVCLLETSLSKKECVCVGEGQGGGGVGGCGGIRLKVCGCRLAPRFLVESLAMPSQGVPSAPPLIYDLK